MVAINPLVPELECLDLGASLRFYLDVLGFEVLYDRPDQKFAFLHMGDAQIMLKQANGYWETGPLEPPLGRGMNLQIAVPEISSLLARLQKAGRTLFAEPETSWYRAGDVEKGQTEFLVQDPDGYLLRFAASLGERPHA